jgi:hypothetical protein
MRTPDRSILSKADLSRLRQALAREQLAETRDTSIRGSFVALFLSISAALWHGAGIESLSLAPTSAVQPMRFVSPHASTARTEQKDMQRLAIVGALAAASAAFGQNSGFARFSATSDTIRIQGNTVFPTADFTYEMRVRVAEGASLGHVISEQRDTFEAKIVALSANNFYGAMTRGALCGAENLTQGGASLSDGWHHIAWVRAGSVARLYLDGVLNAEWASQPNCLGNSPDSWMSIGMIRYTYQQPTLPSFLGDIDWIRVSSTARYLSAFSAPYECEITSDANTQLLLKFNEASGTTTLIDESPNHFQCNVGVAVNPGGTATAPSLGNTTGGFPACTPLCDSDIDANHITDGIDLAIILARWGTAAKDYPRADANLDGIVDGSDLSIVLNGWGPCQ